VCTDENSSSTEWADLEELLDYERCFDGCDASCGDEEDVRVSGETFGLGYEFAKHGYVVWLCLFTCIDFGTRDIYTPLSHDASGQRNQISRGPRGDLSSFITYTRQQFPSGF